MTKDLNAIYKQFVNVSAGARINAMIDALNWYDASIGALFAKKHGLTTDERKVFERAAKARRLGIGASTDGEKETAFLMALKTYDKLFADACKLPKAADAYAQYEAERAALEAKAAAEAARYDALIKAFNTAYATAGLTFGVAKNGTARSYDGLQAIQFDLNTAKSLLARAKTDGIVTTVLGELDYVVRAKSITRNSTGAISLDLAKYAASVQATLDSVMRASAQFVTDWNGAPTPKPAPPTPRVVNPNPTPRPARTASKGSATLVAGKYRAGTAMADYWQYLTDGKRRTYAELNAIHASNNPKNVVWFLVDHGRKSGLWTVKADATGAQMTSNNFVQP